MSARANSLQAALAGAATEEKPKKSPAPKPAAKKKTTVGQGRAAKPVKAKPEPAAEHKETRKPSRAATVLVGGHFPPSVSRQLRIIAAEDGTTNQALLAEALDLLFTKKGKQKIESLTAG